MLLQQVGVDVDALTSSLDVSKIILMMVLVQLARERMRDNESSYSRVEPNYNKRLTKYA